MTSILVTGANGFVGRHVLSVLSQKKLSVHAVSFHHSPSQEDSNVTWHTADLLSETDIDALIKKIQPTHILHLAWYAKPNAYWASLENLKWLQSSLYLLNCFIGYKGQRAVFVGSCAEYEWQSDCFYETKTACKPATLYGAAKQSLYLLSEKIAEQNQLSFAWARLFFLFGEHEYRERLIASAITHLLQKKTFTVSQGDAVRDFLYAQDAADALVQLLLSDVKGAVNIASGKALPIRELIFHIAESLHAQSLVNYQSAANIQPKIISADVTRLQKEVGWSPKFSLNSAMDKTIQWWQTHG